LPKALVAEQFVENSQQSAMLKTDLVIGHE
jgi:hypothetical protein